MNLPNQLTILRIILTLLFVFCFLKGTFLAMLFSVALFMAATYTDLLDGQIARKHQLITDFGKIMDPIADKFLLLSAFYLLGKIAVYPMWMFYVVAFREILITVLRLRAMKRGVVLAAETAGKSKTILQSFTAWIMLIYVTVAKQEVIDSAQLGNFFYIASKINLVLMVLVTALTVYSGVTFLIHNKKALNVG